MESKKHQSEQIRTLEKATENFRRIHFTSLELACAVCCFLGLTDRKSHSSMISEAYVYMK